MAIREWLSMQGPVSTAMAFLKFVPKKNKFIRMLISNGISVEEMR